jgi:AraC family transcriptional regulator of adaptative response/methylated-DNA-[protein]-cysteine methyltransferase
MKTGPIAPFKYNFRTPGCQVEGPIRYAVGQTVRGTVLIGRSRQSICAIFLGEDARELYDQLAVTFPDVELIADRQSLLGELGQVVAFIDKGIAESVINLDIVAALLSSRKSGKHCVVFQPDRRAAIARSHSISRCRRPFEL